MANGTVVTRKGLQLIAKLVASETALTFTRVAIGTGKVPGGYDPGSMTGLNEYKMDGSIASHSASGDEASVVMQISSIGVETGFTITEAGLFATDPDEGEILYAYLDMSADPQYMYPENNAISKFIELTLVVKIGEVQSVTAVINPGSLITEEKFEAEKAETVHKSDIINSFSDTAGDHETVMGTVMGYQHDRDIKWLKGYAVTKEMISNQNVESADLVPSAYLLYQLNKTLLKKCEDLLAKYNALNSNFAGIENKISNDKEYVNSLYQRIGDFKNRTSSSLINDISFMIQTKGIHTGGFGFANVEYADRPSNAPLWGYIEFFHHADGYVTVKYYPDNMPKIYTGQFIIGQSTWAVPWY